VPGFGLNRGPGTIATSGTPNLAVWGGGVD
jgi:hypothetical protein